MSPTALIVDDEPKVTAPAADAVLEKPFTRQEFVITVREVVKRARPATSWHHSQSC